MKLRSLLLFEFFVLVLHLLQWLIPLEYTSNNESHVHYKFKDLNEFHKAFIQPAIKAHERSLSSLSRELDDKIW